MRKSSEESEREFWVTPVIEWSKGRVQLLSERELSYIVKSTEVGVQNEEPLHEWASIWTLNLWTIRHWRIKSECIRLPRRWRSVMRRNKWEKHKTIGYRWNMGWEVVSPESDWLSQTKEPSRTMDREFSDWRERGRENYNHPERGHARGEEEEQREKSGRRPSVRAES